MGILPECCKNTYLGCLYTYLIIAYVKGLS